MSKNITIQEGGVAKQLTVDKLKTNLVGGGTCLWVPEDGTQLGTKHISENGTYKASDDGYYGYSEVTVSGIGSVSGKDPDGSGDDAMATIDPDTGEITINKLPSSIAVVTPPTITNYTDGATIDFRGMVVKAYVKSGELWTDATHPNGVIPISELVLPVTTADKGESYSDKWSDGRGVNATLVSYTEHWDLKWDKKTLVQKWISQTLGTKNGLPAMMGGDGPTQFFATMYSGSIYVWGSTANRALNTYTYDPGREFDKWKLATGRNSYSGNGELHAFMAMEEFTQIASSTVAPTGTESLSPISAEQSIPVQWTRPGDGAILETSFEIIVGPRGGSGED